MEEARELLLKHLYLQGGDGLGISDGKVYNACLDATMEALTTPVVGKCDCDKDIACIVCGEEKGLDGDFWKNKKKYDNPTHEEIEEDCRNIPN